MRTSYNLDLLAASGKLPRVRLLGYGGDFLANAGDSANQFSSSANNGGTIAIGQHVCESDCSLPKIGVRVVRNAVNLQAHGGASVGSGGNGGSVSLLLEGQRNLLVATVDASAVEQSGTIDVEGGAGAATNGWSGSGGQVQIGTDTGDVKQSGAIEASGGASDVVANTFQPGAGGRIQLGGFAIANSATIAARGGQTPRNVGQRGGIYLTGYLVTNSATLETSGAPLVSTFVGDPVTDDEGVGEIVLHAVGTLENTATLVANGLGRSWDTEAQSAGGIIKLRGASVHDTMALSATGAACADATDGYAGKGGLLVVAGTTIELTGALTANGAACGKGNTLSNAGDGGTIFLRGVVSGSVVLNARGADEPASGTNSYGGSGGLVDWTGAALGTIDAQGGKVTPTASPINYALGGNGGVVKVSGNNAAAIQARGGNGDGATTTSGGDGGRVTVGGSNSACIDVSVGLAIGGSSNGDSGVITPADLPNFCL